MGKLRVLLAFIYNSIMTVTMEDIGICIITSVLRENGYEVMLISSEENEVNYDEIVGFKPDIAGFTVYSMSKSNVYNVASKVKSLLPSVFTVVGGVYATYSGKQMLEENEMIDCAIRGEGEETFVELLQRIGGGTALESVMGITYRNGQKIVENDDREPIQDLDRLPFAARDILARGNMKIALVSTSRGCNSRCTFCSSQLFWKKWRGKSVKNILDELEYVVKNFDITMFNFIDSSFEDPYIDLRRVRDIAQGIIDRGLFIFYFIDVRAEFHKKVTPELMELLKKSGLNAVCIGIEAGNEDDLKLYNKIASVEDNSKVIELFRQYDISISPVFINFNPYSTVERLKCNIDFLEKHGYTIRFFSFLDVYNGTVIYNKISEDGLLHDGGVKRFKYRFIHRDIELLAEYLYEYKNDLNKRYNNIFGRYDFYSEIYPHLLGYYKRNLEFKADTKALVILEEHKGKYSEIQKKFNFQCAQWIKELLDIASAGWDRNHIDACTSANVTVENFIEVVNQLDNLKDKLYLSLSRLGYWSLLTRV